jgi:hypothetical protein
MLLQPGRRMHLPEAGLLRVAWLCMREEVVK